MELVELLNHRGIEYRKTNNPSEILISFGLLLRIYPPLIPLILLTILFFFNFKNICSKYRSDIPCLNEISLRLTALLVEKTAISARAITAYLDFVFSFIIVYLCDLYIYPTKIVKF